MPTAARWASFRKEAYMSHLLSARQDSLDDFADTLPPGVRVIDEIREEDLRRLIRRDDFAVVIPGFFSEAACQVVADRLLTFAHWTTYEPGTGAERIGTIGNSLFGCLGQELCPKYFDSVHQMSKALCRHFAPYEFPIHRVLREVGYAWPHGVRELRISGKPCFTGVCRVFRDGGEAYPHDDRADLDFPCDETRSIQEQLFVNVYVKKTESGGRLQFWNRVITNRSEYDTLRFYDDKGNKTYGLDRSRIGPPDVEFDPPIGALVIASARRIHAVTACAGAGERLSISGFVDFVSQDLPLFHHS